LIEVQKAVPSNRSSNFQTLGLSIFRTHSKRLFVAKLFRFPRTELQTVILQRSSTTCKI